jgi:hypothetical protein
MHRTIHVRWCTNYSFPPNLHRSQKKSPITMLHESSSLVIFSVEILLPATTDALITEQHHLPETDPRSKLRIPDAMQSHNVANYAQK